MTGTEGYDMDFFIMTRSFSTFALNAHQSTSVLIETFSFSFNLKCLSQHYLHINFLNIQYTSIGYMSIILLGMYAKPLDLGNPGKLCISYKSNDQVVKLVIKEFFTCISVIL